MENPLVEFKHILGRIKRNAIKNYSVGRENSIIKLNAINEKKVIYYFGVPRHANLGDLAQCLCIRKFLAEQFPEYIVTEVDTKVFMDEKYKQRKLIKECVKNDDLIVFQSGYCTQDLGGIEDLMHQTVMKDFPNNKMLMLPQTIYFKSEKRKQQASKIYNAHKHLFFLARDTVSYKMALKLFPDISVRAYPDIVTTLIGQYFFHEDRNGVLLCMRNDAEKYYSEEVINELRRKINEFSSTEQLDTTINEKVNVIYANLQEFIENYIRKFAKYKVVITDRYHGTIFSLIANTPVIVVKTTDHKVKTGVDWFREIYDENVIYVDDIDDVPQVVKKILQRKIVKKNDSYFKERYYDKLRAEFEKNVQ